MSIPAYEGDGANGGPSNLGGNMNGTMDSSALAGSVGEAGDAVPSKINHVEDNGPVDGADEPREEIKPLGHPHNPQLGPEPWFTYPTPTPSQLQEDLPPYDESEGIPMGLVLDRVARKGYGDMKVLLQQTLPKSPIKQRPRHIIDYAKSQRHAILKYLAVLRWKMAVDIDLPGPSNAPPIPHPHPLANGSAVHGGTSFPTPHSIGESSNTSPSAEVVTFGKGKGRAVEDEKTLPPRGKVTDAKRITHFMEHQNRQHEMAIGHIQHVSKMIETLRERNPDLLTAISLLESGTYTRLPTALIETFTPLVPLTNRRVLRTLRRLNRNLLYRLQCVDYVPPELVIRAVKDGKIYVGSGGPHGWRAHLTVIGFGEGDEARWWLTGVEWGWRYKGRGENDLGGEGFRSVTGEARQGILDIVNEEILRPREVDPSDGRGVADEIEVEAEAGVDRKVDAPLVRMVNFLQHLHLTQQLEALYIEAAKLNQGKWRGNIQAEMKRDDNSLSIRYWIRPRPPAPQTASHGPNQPKRPPETNRFIFGGCLTISVAETGKASMIEDLMRDVTAAGRSPVERVLPLCLDVKWEIGEAGAGGGLKAGDKMDPSSLQVDSSNLSLEDILTTAAQAHASHLLRVHTASLDISRLSLFPLDSPSLISPSPGDAHADTQALFRIPLPSKQRATSLNISVSPYTGRLDVEDEAGNESRAMRARMATVSLNESKARFTDDLVRLITAILTENLENQMRQLGWSPTRRLPIRYQDLPKNDLYPASSIFVPLSTSPLHLFVAKVTPAGIAFELLRLIRTPADSGVMKFAIGDRSALDLTRLKARRTQVDGGPGQQDGVDALSSAVQDTNSTSSFEMSNRDLRDLYIFSNALVAQSIIEQQLKDRSIPYTLLYPAVSGSEAPSSSSAVAGMVPSLCVNTRDLLKDPRVAEVAMPKVYIQIRDWWKGDKCQVVTVVQLRHRPSLASNGVSPQAPTVAVPSASANSSESITLDPMSSIVRFRESDIGRCVPSFLEEWERLSKVLVVAGEVNRLNKTPQFKHLKMLSFDLCTATLSYATDYSCSITYTPSDDSYEVSFAATPDQGAEVQENPHMALQGLFSHKLNELSKRRNGKTSLATAFCELLCNTLPVLLTINSLQSPDREFPKLVVRSISSYRLVWDYDSKRYALDLGLLPSNRYLLSDASVPPDKRPDLSCGPLTAIPGFAGLSAKICSGASDSPKDPKDNGGTGGTGGGTGMVRLDEGNAFMCPVESVGAITRNLADSIEKVIGLRG